MQGLANTAQGMGDTAQQAPGLELTALQMPQGWELLIILALVFLLFGAKKMPDAARGIGRSLRILKAETHGLRGEDATSAEDGSTDPDDSGSNSVPDSKQSQIATGAPVVDQGPAPTSDPVPTTDVSDDAKPEILNEAGRTKAAGTE